MSKTTNVKATRPNGGTERPLSDHSDQASASQETEARWASVLIRPDEYDLTAYTNYSGNTTPVSNTKTQLVLPEPWRPEDLVANGGSINQSDLLNRTPFANQGITDADGLGIIPSFWLDYEHHPAVIPTALQSNHVRSSVATRWDANGDLVEDSAGTLRLWRDPKTQAVEGLIYEPKRTQLVFSPQDITSADWSETAVSTLSNVGSAKSQNYDELTEDSTDNKHEIRQSFTRTTEGDPVAFSVIVKSNGRDWCYIQTQLHDDDTSSQDVVLASFDIANGATGSVASLTNGTTIDHSIKDLGGGWYRCNYVIKPDSAYGARRIRVGLSDSDVNLTGYTGDGSSGIYVMHAQAEASREVTSPILTGGGVREADAVNYSLSFPDKTCGAAFSVEQQSGDQASTETFQPGIVMNSNGVLKNHGVFMWNGGIDSQGADGFYTIARNTNDNNSSGVSPNEETIDAFQVGLSGAGDPEVSILVRQIAIHTAPHTSQQLSDLESNYLTQP